MFYRFSLKAGYALAIAFGLSMLHGMAGFIAFS
jgi:hypothetical protein